MGLFCKKDGMMDRIAEFIGIDHIGYAVRDMETAKVCFEAFGFEFTENEVDEMRNVNVSIGRQNKGGVRVELLAPLDGVKSPIDGYLKKIGSTPYHICYQVNDMDRTIGKLLELGFTQMGYPASSMPLNGIVCFLYSAEIGVVELITREK